MGEGTTGKVQAAAPTVVERGPDGRYLRVCQSHHQILLADRFAMSFKRNMDCFMSVVSGMQYDTILGKGAFKTVYKGFDEREGIEVAWNQVKSHDFIKEGHKLTQEINVLKNMKHKNVMCFYDSWIDEESGTVNFITELFTSGTLRQYVLSFLLIVVCIAGLRCMRPRQCCRYRQKHKNLGKNALKRWAWQILQGLVYLHGHNPPIIHRDLKCDNIFVNGSAGVVKIGDLGLATLRRGSTAPQSCLGPFPWQLGWVQHGARQAHRIR